MSPLQLVLFCMKLLGKEGEITFYPIQITEHSSEQLLLNYVKIKLKESIDKVLNLFDSKLVLIILYVYLVMIFCAEGCI